jgi:hypothetical protein
MDLEQDIDADDPKLSPVEVDVLAEYWDDNQSERANLNTVYWWLRQANPHRD